MTTRRTRRPTLADVAATAGVSAKTVSRVVNGQPHVSAEVEHRVRAAVAELDYRPDRRARDLASGPSSPLVGFIQVDAGNPFFASVSRGLDDEVRASGFLVISASTDAEGEREAELIGAFAELRVRGLVVAAAAGNDDLLRREADYGTPVVCIDRRLDGAAVDTVVSDNRPASRAAVSRLLERGHERVGFLGGRPEVWTAQERHDGYRDALAEHGIAHDPSREAIGVGDVDAAAAATDVLLDRSRPPTALFTAQDQITMGAVRALRRRGRHHDVALVGFDDIPQATDLDPAVAVVAQDPYQMGRHAGRHLVARLDGTHPAGATTTVVPTTFLPRASADILPPPP